MEVTFFAVVKSFDANTAISANFVLTVKNLSESYLKETPILSHTNCKQKYIVCAPIVGSLSGFFHISAKRTIRILIVVYAITFLINLLYF